jgi:predicted NBD/HSP70 family sugar kinase
VAESAGRELRRTNLSAVLTLVHDRGAVSRAELTRETGLNRSTVSALVGQLVDLRLVRESAVGARQVGRPSRLIEPERRTVALAVHPEPDAVTIGLVGLGGHVIKRIRCRMVQAPQPDEVINIVSAVVAGMRSELDSSYSTVGVGVAVPGYAQSPDGEVDAGHLLGWYPGPFAERLERALDLPVYAAGEAAAGALGERAFGAAREVRNLVFLTAGGSSVSAAVIGDGNVLSGADGYAGALGHVLVNSDGASCACGARGCLDTEVSQNALLEELGLPAGHDLESALRARRDDPRVAAVVHRQLDHLAVGVRFAVNIFDPELVVLGDYLGVLLEFDPARLAGVLGRCALRSRGESAGVRVARASLGDDLVVVGAAQLALSRVLQDPARLATHRVAHRT